MKYNIDDLSIEERGYAITMKEHINNNRFVREDGLSQIDVVIKSMLDNRWKLWWRASDFQSGNCFIGYEATSAMSRAAKKYPGMFKSVKVGRYRFLGLNWDDTEDLPMFVERFQDLPVMLFEGSI